MRQPTSTTPDSNLRPLILYLVTSEFSSSLFKGQLNYLDEHGFEVVVGCGSGDGSPVSMFDESAEVVYLPFTREPSPFKDLTALRATIRLIRRVKPDIVNVSTPKASVIGAVAAQWCRIPVRVLVIRGFRFESLRGPRRWMLRLLDKVAARSSTHVIFNSPSLREFAVRQGVVRTGRGLLLGSGSGNGVDLERFSPAGSVEDRMIDRASIGITGCAPVLGFVGRLTNDKGVDDAIAVLDAERSCHPDARLLLLGPFETGDPLPQSLIARISDDASIEHREWCDDMPTAYRAMDLLVFPSIREGLPNAPLEAQACGTPVVAYAATGSVDAVVDGIGGLLAPVGDRPSLASAVARVLEDDALRGRLGRSGRRWVEARFDRKVVWSELERHYRSWLRGESPIEAQEASPS